MVLRVLLVLIPLVALAQEPSRKQDPAEWFHLHEDSARALYRVSAFAHGHRHGYEAGYLAADADIHFGHFRRQLREKDVPGSMRYRREYGDKGRFRRGFIYGFLAGYDDSYQFRPFRLPEWTAEVPAFSTLSDLPESDAPSGPDAGTRRRFDDGAIAGYRTATSSQFIENRPQALARQASESCKTESRAAEFGYCDGFVQGFLFGAADHPPPAEPAPSVAAAGHVP